MRGLRFALTAARVGHRSDAGGEQREGGGDGYFGDIVDAFVELLARKR